MSEGRLSRRQIWAYGSLGIPLSLLGYPLGVWLPRAYASYIGIPLEVVGSIISAAAIFDAITDPAVGFASDRMRSRFGRRRIWLSFGTPVLFVALWYILNPAAGGTAFYLAAWFLCLRLGTTLVLVPYSAWGAELSGDYHTRTRIVSARQAGTLIGLIGAASIPFLVESMYGDEASAVRVLNAYTAPVLLLLPLTVMLVLTSVPEQAPRVQAHPTSFLNSLSLMRRNKLFLRLVTISVLIEGGEAFRNALSLFFIQDYIGASRAGALYLVYFSMGLAALRVWDWIASRYGKHRSLAAAIVFVGFVSLAVLPLEEGLFLGAWRSLAPEAAAGDSEMAKTTQILLFNLLFALKGFCFGAFAYLPRAMLADAIDVDTLRSGDVRSGAYFSIHGFMDKAAQSLGGTALIVLALVGYDQTPNASHTASDLAWLGTLYAIVPTVSFGAALWLCWTWPMTSEVHAKLQRLLARRSVRRPNPS